MKNLVIGIGEALWDILPDGKKIGGAPANFSYHVSQFGLNSLVISAVGHDKLGNEILSDFDGKLLNHHISKVEYPTGTVQVELDNEGVPYYDIRENVAWDNIPFTDSMKDFSNVSFTLREAIWEIRNCRFAGRKSGYKRILNIKFFPASDSHEFPTCPFPAV